MAEPLHASAFAHHGAGCLILGPSGSGKSRLVAEAILHGAKLIADDRVELVPMMGLVAIAAAPELSGVLELRGLGLIKFHDPTTRHVLHLVVELDPACDTRLPELESREFLGVSVPYIRVPAVPAISGAQLLLYLKAMQEGRVLPTDWMPKRS